MKYMDIIQVRSICKWCRRPIRATGLEHALCRLVYVTNHDWAHQSQYSAPQRIKIPVLDANGCRLVGGIMTHDDFCSDDLPEDKE